jgi:hypothetical protein
MIKNSLEGTSKEFFHIFFPTDSWKKQKKGKRGFASFFLDVERWCKRIYLRKYLMK